MFFFKTAVGWLEFLLLVAVGVFVLSTIARIFRRCLGPGMHCGRDPCGPKNARNGQRASASDWTCDNADCHAGNAEHAKFCRTCGRPRPGSSADV